ncbi:MAG: hypothetical protein RL757_3314 [Bacteroidota bacterium]|jgi:TonB family protein
MRKIFVCLFLFTAFSVFGLNAQDTSMTLMHIERQESPPPPEERKTTTELEQIYSSVEEKPIFIGGEAEMARWIRQHLIYPKIAEENLVEGNVYVRVVVNADGTLTDIGVLRGIGGGCNEEAVRLVSAMPRWKAGIQDGKNVRVSEQIKVKFNIDEAKDKDTIDDIKLILKEKMKLYLADTSKTDAKIAIEDAYLQTPFRYLKKQKNQEAIMTAQMSMYFLTENNLLLAKRNVAIAFLYDNQWEKAVAEFEELKNQSIEITVPYIDPITYETRYRTVSKSGAKELLDALENLKHEGFVCRDFEKAKAFLEKK